MAWPPEASALRQLQLERRAQIIELRFYKCKTIREIAVLVGLSTVRVYKILQSEVKYRASLRTTAINGALDISLVRSETALQKALKLSDVAPRPQDKIAALKVAAQLQAHIDKLQGLLVDRQEIKQEVKISQPIDDSLVQQEEARVQGILASRLKSDQLASN